MKPNRTDVEVYDTTLRDGTQREGISLSCEDKLRIARRLDRLGIAYIEGGWPGSNPKDVEFFERAQGISWKSAIIAAFGSTRRAGVKADADASVAAMLSSGAEVCTVFGKSWTLQVTEVLRTTLQENLRMIEETAAYLNAKDRRVFYDAEHFFDGYEADPDYALQTVVAAANGGAEHVILCDTNGGTLPWRVEEVVEAVVAELGEGVVVGIHTHDDGGCAVANSLAAVRAGARHVQGTVNGYGERCGNANLCAVIPDLELKMGYGCLPEGGLPHLTEVHRFVAEVANLATNDHMAYVGRSAFAHKGGVHVSAMRRNADSYQHVEPERVGNKMRVVVSELSGRSNVLSKAEEAGIDVLHHAASEVLDDIKESEARGFSFEAAEASVVLRLRRRDDNYVPPFRILDYKVFVGHPEQQKAAYSEAMVKVAVGDKVLHTAAEGAGPVEALDQALRKALEEDYPGIGRIQLKDYKVRILDGRQGTSATTRVLIDSSDGDREWSTVGASSNIIEASCGALIDGIEYGLHAQSEQAGMGSPASDTPPKTGDAQAKAS